MADRYGDGMLSYDDVLLVPGYSDIEPSEDLSVRPPCSLGDLIGIPIISAAMDTVTGTEMAVAMNECHGTGVIHRNCSIDKQIEMVEDCKGRRCAVAVGPTDDAKKRIDSINPSMWIVDVAHGHTCAVGEIIRYIKKIHPGSFIVAGNVVTKEATAFLEDAGVDAVKVGVGVGTICTTRKVTGVGFPQFSAIEECNDGVPIIADGGICCPGDMVKALAAGASAVMMGNALAGTDESLGTEVHEGDVSYKTYRGMGSKAVLEAKSTDRYFESAGKAPEGVSGLVPAKGPVKSVIDYYISGLKSAMYYLGCRSIEELWQTRYVKISSSAVLHHGSYNITTGMDS